MEDTEDNFTTCKNCGQKILKDTIYCSSCGAKQNEEKSAGPQESSDYTYHSESFQDKTRRYPNASRKSRGIAALLCYLVGGFGVHRFYVGRTTSGIMMILFGWATLGIWWLVDFIMILCGEFKDIDGKPLKIWDFD